MDLSANTPRSGGRGADIGGIERSRALRDGADMLAGFDQSQDDWPVENRMDRATVRRCCQALRAMADASDKRTSTTPNPEES